MRWQRVGVDGENAAETLGTRRGMEKLITPTCASLDADDLKCPGSSSHLSRAHTQQISQCYSDSFTLPSSVQKNASVTLGLSLNLASGNHLPVCLQIYFWRFIYTQERPGIHAIAYIFPPHPTPMVPIFSLLHNWSSSYYCEQPAVTVPLIYPGSSSSPDRALT